MKKAIVYLRESGQFELGALKGAIAALEAQGVQNRDMLVVRNPHYDPLRGRWSEDFFTIETVK